MTIPPKDMKRSKVGKINGKPHLILLATQAVEILRELNRLTGGGSMCSLAQGRLSVR